MKLYSHRVTTSSSKFLPSLPTHTLATSVVISPSPNVSRSLTEDDDIQSYSSNRQCQLIHSEKHLHALRLRCSKKPQLGSSLNTSLAESIKSAGKQKGKEDLLKVVLIGASSSGKTSLLLRFNEDKFSDSYLCTIGVDFKIKTVEIDRQAVKLQIWDTAGQERFKSISQAYYRNSHGCVAVYDICSRHSFDALSE